MVTGATDQIVAAYEQQSMTPEQIVESFGNVYDIVAVKAVLMQFSTKYRKECRVEEKNGSGGGGNDTRNFTDQQLERANQVIYQIMEYAEDDNTRLRAAVYVRDDKKGRLDVVNKFSGQQINIVQFQMLLDKANQALALTQRKAKELTNGSTDDPKPTARVTDVELVA